MKRLAFGCFAAALLAAQIGLAWAGGGSSAAPAPQGAAPPTLTVKERLSSKASDDQRVDNCKVPPDRRGPRSRPDCRERPGAAPTH
jgi:hypothetical protein